MQQPFGDIVLQIAEKLAPYFTEVIIIFVILSFIRLLADKMDGKNF